MRNAERVVQLMMGELMGSYMTAASLFSGWGWDLGCLSGAFSWWWGSSVRG